MRIPDYALSFAGDLSEKLDGLVLARLLTLDDLLLDVTLGRSTAGGSVTAVLSWKRDGLRSHVMMSWGYDEILSFVGYLPRVAADALVTQVNASLSPVGVAPRRPGGGR